MAPTESDILKHYLLLPAPLTSIQTLDQFRALFPRSWQAHPQVRLLFRDLQAQRNIVINTVTENIDAEARRGVAMRREVLRVALEESRDDDGDAEVDIERAVRLFFFSKCLKAFFLAKTRKKHSSLETSRAPNAPNIPSTP